MVATSRSWHNEDSNSLQILVDRTRIVLLKQRYQCCYKIINNITYNTICL